jgi:CheY-like chemotaxis protein
MSSPLTPIAACRQPQNRHACQLEIRSPGLQGVATVTDLVSLAREKRPELVVVDIRIPPTRTTEGLDTARVIHEELSDIGILVLSAHVEIGHATADRISRVGDFSICVLSPSARSTANGSPTPRIRSPRPIGPLATATTCRSGGPSSSWAQVLDTPISGLIFLEQVIRDSLDIGRPDQVGLVFDPVRSAAALARHRDGSRTRVITAGVTPSLHVDDKTHHDQAVRECPAHRDHHHRHQRFRDRETTDESARAAGDRRHRQPAPARRPTNRPRPDHRGPIPAHRHRTRHHRDRHPHPRPAPRGERRSHALLTALTLFRLQPNGFANKDLRPLIAELRAAPPDTVTYDL